MTKFEPGQLVTLTGSVKDEGIVYIVREVENGKVTKVSPQSEPGELHRVKYAVAAPYENK